MAKSTGTPDRKPMHAVELALLVSLGVVAVGVFVYGFRDKLGLPYRQGFAYHCTLFDVEPGSGDLVLVVDGRELTMPVALVFEDGEGGDWHATWESESRIAGRNRGIPWSVESRDRTPVLMDSEFLFGARQRDGAIPVVHYDLFGRRTAESSWPTKRTWRTEDEVLEAIASGTLPTHTITLEQLQAVQEANRR